MVNLVDRLKHSARWADECRCQALTREAAAEIERMRAECTERHNAQVALADLLAATKKALADLVADCSDDKVDWPALTRARSVLGA